MDLFTYYQNLAREKYGDENTDEQTGEGNDGLTTQEIMNEWHLC